MDVVKKQEKWSAGFKFPLVLYAKLLV